MEKKNKHVRVGFSTILCGVLAILLCAAQGVLAQDVTVPSSTHPSPCDIDYTISGNLNVNAGGTVNLLTGANITYMLYAWDSSSVVNIKGGQVGWWIAVMNQYANITVYGKYFEKNGMPLDPIPNQVTFDAGTNLLFVTYSDNTFTTLTFDSSYSITINLVNTAGGESITVNIEKAKVSWDHSDIHVDGKLYLPQGFWMDTLEPVGCGVTTLAGVKVANQSVEFEIKGKKDDKWEYKDKENIDGPIKEFKIDWKGAKFDYKGDEGLHIHTHFIGGTETTLCIHCDHISGAFTVSVNGTTIAYNEERIITTGVEYEPQKDDNTHVHFPLPFQLTSDMTIEVSGAVELSIAVADDYEEGFVKFKLVSAFDSVSFPQGSESSPEELEIEISLGEAPNTISGSDLIEAWTKQDHKHWEYK